MKILLLGDSFCYVSSKQKTHWVNMLGEAHTIENCSNPGIGQYKIWKQYRSQKYDVAVVHHTSPYRIHTLSNPIHDGIRRKSDFMLGDIEYHASNGNSEAKKILRYLTKYVDYDYQEKIHELLYEQMLKIPKSIHFTMFDNPMVKNNFHDIFLKHRDKHSDTHLTAEGHRLIYERIKELVDKYYD
jgi:hypothetical protein